MSVTFDLPPEMEQKLRAENPNLDAAAKAAYALDLFRRGKLTHFELSTLLGLDRFETGAYLKRNQVIEGSITSDDLDHQEQVLDRVLGPVRR